MRASGAIAQRVLRQLRRDHRTIGMLLVMPCALMSLLAWMFTNSTRGLDTFGPPLLAIFPFTVMFLVTSISTLRERTGGTLERLMAIPIKRSAYMAGYAGAFGTVAAAQSAVLVAVSVGGLGMRVQGPTMLLVCVAIATAVLGTALGLFVSAFARTEFQAVQFLPAVVMPQLLLCGLFVAPDLLPTALRLASDLMPLTYAVRAMQDVSAGAVHAGTYVDLLLVLCAAGASLVLGASTLSRMSSAQAPTEPTTMSRNGDEA